MIVNSTNEALNDKNPVSERIHKISGPLLKEEVRQDLQCKKCIFLNILTFILCAQVCKEYFIREYVDNGLIIDKFLLNKKCIECYEY